MKHPFSKDQLKDLPHEIHLAVMDLIDPLDIISLSKTCHAFHTTCSERTIWTNAFRRMCSLNMAFIPSYPAIQDMSVIELRQHAASPSRLTALLYKVEESTSLGRARPCRNQRYILRPPNTDIGTFFDIFLVPGGRYLITTADHLHIWDLGLTSQDDPSLVATFHGGLNLILGVQQTPDGNGLLVAVSALMPGAETSIVYYNPSSLVKELSPFATLNHPNCQRGNCVLTKSLFIYIHDVDDVLVFWSFYDDLWMSYALDVYRSLLITNIAHQGTTLFLFFGEAIRGYEMPSPATLKSRAEFFSQPASGESSHPMFTLAAAVPDVGLDFVNAFPLEMWYGGDPVPFSFDVAFCHPASQNDYFALSSYCIQPESSATDSTPAGWKLTFQYDFRKLIEDGIISYSSDNGLWKYRKCNGHVVRSIPNDSRQHLKVLATLLGLGDPVLLTADFHLPELDQTSFPLDEQYSFDPISGRMCTPDMNGRIAILDFLQPPRSVNENST